MATVGVKGLKEKMSKNISITETTANRIQHS